MGLGAAHGGDDRIDLAEHGDHRRHAGNPAQRAVESELADEAEPVDELGRQLLVGHQHPDGDRQVETGADLAQARRRQVDRDAAVGPFPPGAHHRRPHPVAGLAACRIGLADDAETGQALADVHLDPDRDAGGPEEAGGRDGCEHGGPPTIERADRGGAARPHDVAGDGTEGVSASRRRCGGGWAEPADAGRARRRRRWRRCGCGRAGARLRPVRLRRTGPVAACAAVSLGLLALACDDDGPGDTARFCAEVQDNLGALVTPPATLDEVDEFLDLYRRVGDDAPLAIEPHWQALVLAYETASTVDPDGSGLGPAGARRRPTRRSGRR